MQTVRDHNKKLAEDLGLAHTQLEAVKAKLEGVKKFTRESHGKNRTGIVLIKINRASGLTKDEFIAAESINQLQKDLETAREAQRYAESQQEAVYRVLSRSHGERDKLKAENQQQAQEIQSLKAQLALSQEENQKLKAGMFGKYE
jgi:hypothetical protein